MSAVLPALRPHTEICALAVIFAGRHTTLALGDQSWNTVQADPSNCHHLYEYGWVPPVAVAVNVIAVPTGCGALRSGTTLRIVNAWAVPLNVAVTEVLPFRVKLHTRPAPAHSGPHPPNVLPSRGLAVS